jgi:NADH:ubiquinone oxidoreductase subunit 4 (subunit M)
MQKVFYGKTIETLSLPDFSIREKIIMVPMVVFIIWLGLFPQPILDTAKQAIQKVLAKEISSSDQNSMKVESIVKKGGDGD